MVQLIAALLLAIIPQSDMPTDRVDVIELNHFYNSEAKHVFSQWLLLDWNENKSRHDIVEWAMCRTKVIKDGKTFPHCRNEVVATKNGWRLEFLHNGVLRCVFADQFRETFTQFDREVAERETLPKELRRGLSRPLREPVLDSTIRTNFIR